jgi:ABC-type glycerol-3-phosphate transport system substrate-binding protein
MKRLSIVLLASLGALAACSGGGTNTSTTTTTTNTLDETYNIAPDESGIGNLTDNSVVSNETGGNSVESNSAVTGTNTTNGQ